jgi:hypothetical protein
VTETSVYAWRERFDNAELNALPAEAFDRRLPECSRMSPEAVGLSARLAEWEILQRRVTPLTDYS